MPCVKGEACACTVDETRLSRLPSCAYWTIEQPRDELDAWHDRNWRMIPAALRERCLAHLRTRLPAETIERWRATYRRGNAIGSDEPRFHFANGVGVRNILREVVRDGLLPVLPGEFGSNWDNFYCGALNALVRDA